MNSRRLNAVLKATKTRKQNSYGKIDEEELRRALEGLSNEANFSEQAKKEVVTSNLFYNWNKNFAESGKKGLFGNTENVAIEDQIYNLKMENLELKQLVAELTLELRHIKKNFNVPE